MKPQRLLLLVLFCVLTTTVVLAQFTPRKDYVWARDILGATMTLDGVLNEAVWAKADSVVITYGDYDGTPSSGWKIANGSGTPHDGANAVLKFLVDNATNRLYVGLVAKDSSVGGAGWENSDGLLGGFYDRRSLATSEVSRQRDIFMSWVDSTAVGAVLNVHGGDLPTKGIIAAAATVQGVSNSDTNGTGALVADQGWTLEMVVYLDSLGYTANVPQTDAIQMSACIWDVDWPNSPGHIATKAWWLNEWGNNGGGTAGRILVRNDVNVNTAVLPTYGPDLTIPNATNYTVTVDGDLNEDVWAHVPYFDIQFGNSVVKNNYPTIGKDRSGQWVTRPIGSLTAVDPGRARIKMFFKGDVLYVGADVNDQAISSYIGDDFFDGLQVNMNVPTDSLRDPNVHSMGFKRFGFAVDSVAKGGSSLQWDAVDWATKGAITYGLNLKPGSTINDPSDIDAGYTVEAAFDLTKLGYTPDEVNKMVAIGFDYHDYDQTPTDTSSYRVWWFREWPWACTPAFCLLDNASLVTGVEAQGEHAVAGEFRLVGNYPNPFNPSTSIRITLPDAGTARLQIYNLLGQLVQSSEFNVKSAGTQDRLFDASGLATGVYYYRVAFTSQHAGTSTISATKKMVLVK
jgi:hypothetical protein